ncbi:TetR/AcrR family transcriptional regulator [Sphingomonas crocodyli]|uniref:TetR/AcrR family transcriptional regulator n=1 Tax=Sphingomonas crocodyli TaxID=1979270 RepID=A0A437LUR3_9SPHN|nr:TetR/AcrR family transcriptional regulator [Sphingomonas crocodyli]RVT89171.1 TetR/AcrR family transcriptional regulator [Sphingomonas crocodyli]
MQHYSVRNGGGVIAGAQTQAGEPRKRDADRTRAAILRAATREFGTHGFSGGRTERIAAAARCNIRLLYHHFGNKQALYLAVIESAYADLRAQEAELAFDLSDPLGSVEALLRFTFGYFEKNPLLEGLIRSENMMQGRFLRQSQSVPEAAGRLKERLAAIIAAGEAKGVMRPGIDPVQLYVTITALSRFHLANSYTLSNVLGADLRSAAWRAAWLTHSIDLLRAWVKP